MKLSNFKFKLPEEQIAQFPSRFRDEARLLVGSPIPGILQARTLEWVAISFYNA